MSIIVSSAYALSAAAAVAADYPIILWDSCVAIDTIAADEEDPDYPASNLANPSTSLLWKSGSTLDQYLTITPGAPTEMSCIAVVRHNWGSGATQVTVEGNTGAGWATLVGPQLLADDKPAMFRFDAETLTAIRFKLEPGSVEPEAAVIYAGPLLVFERGVQPHVPLPYARRRNVMTPRSQAGDFLGRIIVGGTLQTTVDFIKLSAAWFRSALDPFLEAAGEVPFFFAWSPYRYPAEVGFAWLTADVVPSPSDLMGYVNLSLPLEGILT